VSFGTRTQNLKNHVVKPVHTCDCLCPRGCLCSTCNCDILIFIMVFPMYHFSRISGMRKKCADGGLDFWPEHYRYYGEPFNISPQATVLVVLCDNCDENHACNYENCELVCNSKNCIQTIYLMNVHLYNNITVCSQQSIGTLYDLHLEFIFGTDTYIDEQYFFTHVNHYKKVNTNINKICIFTSYEIPVTIEIHWMKNYQMLTTLACGWNFFCICHPFRENNFYFHTSSKYVILSMPCHKPNLQYYVLYKKSKPLSLFHLSISSVIQNNLNQNVFLSKIILENTPKCHLQHLLPWGRKYYNKNCSGNGPFSSSIADW